MAHNDTTEQEKGLTGKQRQAALHLAEGLTAIAAAKAVGVSRETMERWKRNPAFQKAVREHEDEQYHDQLRMLKKTAGAAIACLVRNIKDGKPYVQIAAASKLLDLAIDVHSISQLQAEIDELKKQLELATQGGQV